ncbi:MAG: hypothetical protein J6Y02_22185 [Pseudobutyrivibrio sp.]|nr:hypothetical protein [Pseudobutyrivibrio sp.]
MLEIKFDAIDGWDDTDEDESKHHFIDLPPLTIRLEHSLVSISKWEMKYHKPYLVKENRTLEEQLDYIKFMVVEPKEPIDENYFRFLTPEQHKMIDDYIEDPMTATLFYDVEKQFGKKDIITNEIIYYWLVTLQIPFEVQYWHINRLITLVKVVNMKNNPGNKLSKSELYKRNLAQNEARLAKYKTTG